ncbi:MAG: CBS domain-containing protein [Planctomycetota bacterium]|nr:MAG: CBS domain-containing protein [Planctomycetota bacterium]
MGKHNTPLKEVLSSDVVSINPQDTLREALNVMVENRVSALPVIDVERHCIGIISVTDLLGMTKDLGDELNALAEAGGADHKDLVARLENADLLTEPVQGWMSSDVVSLGSNSTVQQAAREMVRNSIHRLVVLDDKKRLAGVVSTMDLLAVYCDD